jgi:uncharacterized protein (DUF2141 family)
MELIHKIVTVIAISVGMSSCGVDEYSSDFNSVDEIYNEEFSLTFSFTNIKKDIGNMCVSIFDEHGGFPDEDGEIIYSGCFDIQNVKENGIKILLPAGKYASAVFHDENGNGELDKKRIVGIKVPKEPFGFSNNPKIRTKAPSFEDCSFDLDSDTNLSIKLKKI